MNKSILILVALLTLASTSCEDPVPLDDYTPRKIIESYIIVGEPIHDLAVSKTQALNVSFSATMSRKEGSDLVSSFIIEELNTSGAVVNSLQLERDTANLWGAIDKSYLVKPSTKYMIRISFQDGDSATGETITPGQISWNENQRVRKSIQFPIDTLKAPSTDTLSWNAVQGGSFYMIGIRCLDTTGYGQYLIPSTDEQNRRIERSYRNNNFFREISFNALIANTKSSVVWGAFKWFGRQEVAMYAPDFNMIRWFLANRGSRDYNPLLGSLKTNSENTFGFFASASVARDTVFLVKNQP